METNSLLRRSLSVVNNMSDLRNGVYMQHCVVHSLYDNGVRIPNTSRDIMVNALHLVGVQDGEMVTVDGETFEADQFKYIRPGWDGHDFGLALMIMLERRVKLDPSSKDQAMYQAIHDVARSAWLGRTSRLTGHG